MIDQLSIFHRGGVVLFNHVLNPLPTDVVNPFIRHVLIEEQHVNQKSRSTSSFQLGMHTLKWVFHNELDLVFVAVYLTAIEIGYVDALLETVRKVFVKNFGEVVRNFPILTAQFGETYDKIVRVHEKIALRKQNERAQQRQKNKIQKNAQKQRENEKNDTGVNTGEIDDEDEFSAEIAQEMQLAENEQNKEMKEEQETQTHENTATTPMSPAVDSSDEGQSQPFLQSPSKSPSSTASTATSPASSNVSESNAAGSEKKLTGAEKIQAMQAAKRAKEKERREREAAESAARKSANTSKVGKKIMQTWNKPKELDASQLDYSKKVQKGKEKDSTPNGGEWREEKVEKVEFDDSDNESYDDLDVDLDLKNPSTGTSSNAALAGDGKKKATGWMSSMYNFVAGQTVTSESLAPVVEQLRTQLMAKNVAADIAGQICDAVAKSLEGKKVGSFTTIRSTVLNALEEALTKILIPNRTIDVLAGILQAKEQQRPYTIVFVGVNGVGKSTTLSKVAAYFQSKQLKVAISACDTFRAGAIEQLQTHARRLDIEVYSKGYDKDASAVAADSIACAKKDGVNVLLVDTAGRMQDNEPLMRALSKLINYNRPDLVLFVGEALVGNDAVDQITKFNKALADLAAAHESPRLIDGIVLTKFDTIDDKVGAAISLTYSTGQPIVFVGTGQSYKDLKKMNVKMVVKALLK